jgi:Zn-dependent peptidase ImmA (M78 family)
MLLHAGVEVTSENLPRLERQANRFASAFLLPRTTFPSEIISTSITYFEFLKERWGVAIAAMVYRCKDLGILNDSQVKYLWRQMNTQGIRKKEPLDDRFQQTEPTVLRSSLEMLTEHGVQSKEDIRRKINLNPEDIEALTGCQPGWLAGGQIVAFRPRLRPQQAG